MWLKEREQNALLIADMKTGKDRAGWLEDAAYLHDAVAMLDADPAPAAVPAEVCECGHGGDWHTRRSAYGCLVSGCICPSFRPAPAKSNKEGN
jgi:hypothetical protein